MSSRVARTRNKVVAGRPSEEADCGMRQARLQLADPTRWWLADPVAPHSHIDKLGGTAGVGGAKQTAKPSAPAWGKKASNL